MPKELARPAACMASVSLFVVGTTSYKIMHFDSTPVSKQAPHSPPTTFAAMAEADGIMHAGNF
jgi:hypothetical protein